MNNAPPALPAGWYPETPDRRTLRWWDGERWTEHVCQRTVAGAARRPLRSRRVIAALLLVGVAVFTVSAIVDQAERESIRDDCAASAAAGDLGEPVNVCADDAAMGVDMFAVGGFVSGLAFVGVGVGEAVRRRKTRRSQAECSALG